MDSHAEGNSSWPFTGRRTGLCVKPAHSTGSIIYPNQWETLSAREGYGRAGDLRLDEITSTPRCAAANGETFGSDRQQIDVNGSGKRPRDRFRETPPACMQMAGPGRAHSSAGPGPLPFWLQTLREVIERDPDRRNGPLKFKSMQLLNDEGFL
jgi:hypothetical protein